MSSQTEKSYSLLSPGFSALAVSQFLSALADNALIFALLVFLSNQGLSEKGPLLQELFVIPYILLAPFAGPLADRLPKNQGLLIANIVKAFGCSLAWFGMSPFLAYSIVGIGACLYSPSKYGILPQMVNKSSLVKANALLEGSTIAAILIGALAGGRLADQGSSLAIGVCFGIYGLAAVTNLLIPKLPSESMELPSIKGMVKDFALAVKVLIGDKSVAASLIGTASFWGAGASLRLALMAWVPIALGLIGASPVSNLMGILSVGIVIGAALAGFFVKVDDLNRAFRVGLLLGPLIVVFALTNSFLLAASFIVLIGVSGGFFAIPLNAMVQEKGHETVGAGRALAVQNLVENATILLFAGLYGVAFKFFGNPIHASVLIGIILLVLLIISKLIYSRRAGE